MVLARTVPLPNGILSGIAGTFAYLPYTTIDYYFGRSSDTFHGTPPLQGGPGILQDYLYLQEAARAYESADLVTTLSFQRTYAAYQADMAIFGASHMGDENLGGWHYGPRDGGSYGVINQTSWFAQVDPQYAGDGPSRSDILVHEIGHGLGLAHTHDSKMGSTTILSETALDSELYTVMSYNFWDDSVGFNQDSSYAAYGSAVSFMALDIAALQHLYGADMSAYTGATSYQLFNKGAGALDTDGSDGTIGIGRALYSIWDAGGADQITYAGDKRVIINLNDATLNTRESSQSSDLIMLGAEVINSGALYGINADVVSRMIDASYYAGGFLSQILNSDGTVEAGGYSIAAGAIIENAIGGSGHDILIGNEQSNYIYGNGGSDYLFGGTGIDRLFGGVSNDHLFGGVSDDYIAGGINNDAIDGGGGFDFAIFDGNRSSYDVTLQQDGSILVTDRIGSEGSDDLEQIERASFIDGFLAWDLNGNAGQAYRLYQAAFDRTPDTEGLGYWIRELDRGAGDLAWVANNFIISDEFQSMYGTPSTVSDAEFLTLLYNNVLDRNPDSQGFQYWMSELDRGFARERVLASFSESVENKANVIDVIQDGIWYI